MQIYLPAWDNPWATEPWPELFEGEGIEKIPDELDALSAADVGGLLLVKAVIPIVPVKDYSRLKWLCNGWKNENITTTYLSLEIFVFTLNGIALEPDFHRDERKNKNWCISEFDFFKLVNINQFLWGSIHQSLVKKISFTFESTNFQLKN